MKFYRCKNCGNVEMLQEGESKELVCCGMKMDELKSKSVDASFEKHVPHCTVEDNKIKVSVGEVLHPMTEEHYIMFIMRVVDNKIDRVDLSPNDIPTTEFDYVKGSKIYAYCNLHGLFESDEL